MSTLEEELPTMRSVLATTMLVLLLAACGPDAATTASDPPAADPPAAVPTPSDEGTPNGAASEDAGASEEDAVGGAEAPVRSITGVLGGDPALEGGCMWIDGEDGARYQLSPAPDAPYSLDTDAIAVLGTSGEVVAQAGDRVVVTGEVPQDMLTFCQVGELLLMEDIGTV